MTDRELEQRLRAWYAAEADGIAAAPADLRESLAGIPASTPMSRRSTSRRGFTLLGLAAVLLVGGALAAGSAFLNPKPVVTPPPDVAIVPPSAVSTTPMPSPTASDVRAGDSIAFIGIVNKARSCLRSTTSCPTPRVSIIGSDGRGAHELFPDGVTYQDAVAWSSDGTRLVFSDDGEINASGKRSVAGSG